MTDDVEVKRQMKNTADWEELLYAIEESTTVTTVKSIAQIIPLAGSVISVTDDVLDNVVKNKVGTNRKKLIECLKNASPSITLDLLSNEDFIIDFVNLYEVVLRLRSNEKVQFMVNLFVSAHCGDGMIDLCEYDEMLERLNRLSLREINLLKLLHEQGITNEEFYLSAQNALGLEKELINNMLSSITQTGFCKEKTGAYTNYTGNTYYTTELYARFLTLIGIDDESIKKDKQKKNEKDNKLDIIENVVDEDIDKILNDDETIGDREKCAAP